MDFGPDFDPEKALQYVIRNGPPPPKKRRKSKVSVSVPIEQEDDSHDNGDALSKLLLSRFGFLSFRDSQRAAIEAAIDGKDVFITMPTGGGKTLCFVLVGLAQKKLVIVVSPLLALMKNQCDALNARGIRSVIYNSTVSKVKKDAIVAELMSDTLSIEILFTTPESLKAKSSTAKGLGDAILFAAERICLFAIDEAHCITSWGKVECLSVSRTVVCCVIQMCSLSLLRTSDARIWSWARCV